MGVAEEAQGKKRQLESISQTPARSNPFAKQAQENAPEVAADSMIVDEPSEIKPEVAVEQSAAKE